MNTGPEYPLSKDGLYAHFMAEAQRKIAREKIPPTTTQAASTLATLARDPSEDEKHFNRPLPPKDLWLREREVNHIFDLAQITPVEDVRRKSKNTLGDAVSEGAKGYSPEKRDLAIEAFRFSPPSELNEQEKKRIAELTPITPPKPVEPPKEKTFAAKLLHKLWKMGIPVDKITKKKLSVDVADE